MKPEIPTGMRQEGRPEKKKSVVLFSLIALIVFIMIVGTTTEVPAPTPEDVKSVPPIIEPAGTPVPPEEIAGLSIRGCNINTDFNIATIDTRIENLRNTTESFELVFKLSDNGKAYKTFVLGPKEKRVSDIPFSGVEGYATAYLYKSPGNELILEKGINLTCARTGDSGKTASMSARSPDIRIVDADKKVIYENFEKGDPWNITMWNATTGASEYQFSGAVGEPDGNGNWDVDLGYLARKPEAYMCASPGAYNVYSNGSHNGVLIEKTGDMTLGFKIACGAPIAPVPELSPVILVSAGLVGLLVVSRKHREN